MDAIYGSVDHVSPGDASPLREVKHRQNHVRRRRFKWLAAHRVGSRRLHVRVLILVQLFTNATELNGQ